MPTMQQTEIKDIIKESLGMLKEKIVIGLQSNDAESVDAAIAELSQSITNMVFKLEELSFEAGRLQEDDGSWVFDDFEDFQEA